MSWNKSFLKFQRLVALSECWEPPRIVTQHHSPHIQTCCLPGHTEVVFPLPPPPLFSLGSLLCLHSFVVSFSVCFRDVFKSDKNYTGVIIECNTQINR